MKVWVRIDDDREGPFLGKDAFPGDAPPQDGKRYVQITPSFHLAYVKAQTQYFALRDQMPLIAGGPRARPNNLPGEGMNPWSALTGRPDTLYIFATGEEVGEKAMVGPSLTPGEDKSV